MNTSQFRDTMLAVGRYEMTVTYIQEAVKSFNSRYGFRTRHDIYFRDEKTGMEYRGEYLTQVPYQEDFTLGEICCFEVTSAKDHEIVKCESSLLIAKRSEGSDAPDVHGVLVAGTTHALALQFAKDLAVAKIRIGYNEGDHIDDILRDAWKMNQWLLDPKEPTPF